MTALSALEYGQFKAILTDVGDGDPTLIATNNKAQAIVSPESEIQGSKNFPGPGQAVMAQSLPVMIPSSVVLYGQEIPKQAVVYTMLNEVDSGVSVYSDPLDVSEYRSASLHLNIGKNKPVTGTMFLQGCNDLTLGSWTTLDTSSSFISSTYDNLSYILHPVALNYKWVRAVWRCESRVQQALYPLADIGGSLSSKYMKLNSPQTLDFPFAGYAMGNQGNSYYPFYRVAGVGTPPSNITTSVPIDLSLNDTLSNVSSKTASIINGLAIGGYISLDGGETVEEFAISPAGDTTETQWHIAATNNTCVLKPYDKTKSYVSQDNGKTWSYYAASGIPQRAKFIKGANGSFVAVGIDMLGNYGVIYTSPDAINWTKRICTLTTPIVSVDCDPVRGVWVAVTTNKILTSSNLSTWTPLDLRVSLQQDWSHVAHNGNTWVVITKDTASAMYCSNGDPTVAENWIPSNQIAGGLAPWHTLIANPNNGLFIAVSSGGRYEFSSDGKLWKSSLLPMLLPSGPYSITWDKANNKFVYSVSNANVISPDGIKWEIYPHKDVSETGVQLASASTSTRLISCFATGLPSDFCSVYSYPNFIMFQGTKASGMISVDPGNTGFTFKRVFPDETSTITLKICCK